jgi:lipoate-protein ligase A
MARDEALLESVGDGLAPPTLRLYRWSEPTISLGYFQKHVDFEQLPAPAGDLPVVRRTTGGGAILHDIEWTYAIALPSGHDLIATRPTALYDRVHEAIIATLGLLNIPACRSGISDDSAAHRGPFFCFERRHCLDVVIGKEKLAGSAQRRTAQSLLQHGSIMIGNRFRQHHVAALSDHINVDADGLMNPLIDALQHHLGESLDRGSWTDPELDAAVTLEHKYGGTEWTCKY